jgi:integrator complex subunit 1
VQVGYLCGAVKLLRNQKHKPDVGLCQSLAYLAKVRGNLFVNDCVSNALCSLLRKDSASYAFKTKGTTSVLTLVVAILSWTYQDVKRWPEVFVKVFLIYFKSLKHENLMVIHTNEKLWRHLI